MNLRDQYCEDYYERGVEKGLSGYQNYRWMPERVLPFANELKKRYLGNISRPTALDFGCAKGFLVKAFNLLGVYAEGFDISEYAINNSSPDIRAKLYSGNLADLPIMNHLVVAKDTLEHIPYEDVASVLTSLKEACQLTCVITVPLGDGKVYRIREYELDKTHVIREDEEWWLKACTAAGFEIFDLDYKFPHAKPQWYDAHPYGNLTLVLKPKHES